MSVNDTEYIFPASLASQLGDLRDVPWQQLIQTVTGNGISDVDRISLIYMIARISGCASCNSDAFRAMKGCLVCAKNAIKRFRGSDAELVEQFEQARKEVTEYLAACNSHYTF